MRTHSERKADAKQTDSHSDRIANGVPIRSQTLEAREAVSEPPPHLAHSSTADVTRNGGVADELDSWFVEGDIIHAYHHHRQAAQHHAREADWNAREAAWHRGEVSRLRAELRELRRGER